MAVHERHHLSFHLTLVQQLHAQTIQNGYYFSNKAEMDSVNIATNLTNLVTAFVDNVLPYIKAFTSQELVYRSIIASCVVPKDGPIVERILETSQGDQVEQSLPSYCAAVLTLRSGFGGKSNRGRSYYSGICEGLSAGSKLDTGTLASFQLLGNQLLNIFGPFSFFSNMEYMIFSRKIFESGENSEPPNCHRNVTQIIARNVLGTQRHRKLGIGN